MDASARCAICWVSTSFQQTELPYLTRQTGLSAGKGGVTPGRLQVQLPEQARPRLHALGRHNLAVENHRSGFEHKLSEEQKTKVCAERDM